MVVYNEKEILEGETTISIWQKYVQNVVLRRFSVLALIIFVLWLARSVMSTVLLTFIFTYLVVHLVRFIQRHVNVPSVLIVLVTYALILFLLYFGVTNYLPKLIVQIVKMTDYLVNFYNSPSFDTNAIMKVVNHYISTSSIIGQVKKGFDVIFTYITSIGRMAITFVMSLILSFFYTVELKQMNAFSRKFLDSEFAWFFQDVAYFGQKFVNTFGVVLEAQFMIAIVNTAITTIVLIFMHMPQILALSIMVFLMSLIPVAGVIISCIPLSIISYSVGGFQDVMYILITILIIHTLETYVLNPQFMSSRTELPVFYTFVVLLISDHLFGTWGLIVGVPVFTFFLDVLGVKSVGKHKRPKKLQSDPNN